jgi:hypothetical protein
MRAHSVDFEGMMMRVESSAFEDCEDEKCKKSVDSSKGKGLMGKF